VQDDIALSVVKELRSTLLGETLDPKAGSEATAQVAAAVKGRSSDPEAYRLYLQARHLMERLTRDDTAKGIEHLKAALDRDPPLRSPGSSSAARTATKSARAGLRSSRDRCGRATR
jgi:hypothetical protein